jgi:hypothetical protein
VWFDLLHHAQRIFHKQQVFLGIKSLARMDVKDNLSLYYALKAHQPSLLLIPTHHIVHI